MNQVGEVNAEALKTPGKLVGQLVTTPAILAAIPVYAISSVGWVVVLSRLNLSVAYPFLASLYIFLPILSMLFLSETLSAQHWAGIVVIGIGVGLVLTAIYVIRVFSQAFFGPVNDKWDDLRGLDLKGWQILPRAILVAVLVYFGFFPSALLDVIDGTTSTALTAFR